MTTRAALRELKNALFDLQAADFNTYMRPLRRMAAALEAEELSPYVNRLSGAVDVDAFLVEAENKALNWPTDREEELGLTIELIRRAGENDRWLQQFTLHHYRGSNTKIIAAIRTFVTSVLVPFERDFRIYVEEKAQPSELAAIAPGDRRRVFIVHGHDEAPRESVARFISTIGLEPIILHEQASRGMTIPEKLVEHGNVGFAVVLLTPDDVGRARGDDKDRPRARQNVILELGYFMGRLGRGHVCALLKDDVEIPSDYLNVVYTPYDANGGWKSSLARELQAAGYEFDWNKVMR